MFRVLCGSICSITLAQLPYVKEKYAAAVAPTNLDFSCMTFANDDNIDIIISTHKVVGL